MNYYLSLGLACFGLAILWRGRGIDWIAGGLIAALHGWRIRSGFCGYSGRSLT